MKPILSIVVLAYNQEKTIGRTLDSILTQKTEYPFEIILGEDASPSDNTRSVCESYAAKYPDKIHLMPKAPNKGIPKHYGDALKECKGRYIAGCAGDDWWHNENKIQTEVEFLEHNLDYVLTYSSTLNYDELNGTTYLEIPARRYEDCSTSIFEGNYIKGPTVCFRAEMLKYIDFEEFLREGFIMEDYPMWIIMAQHGKFHFIEEPLVTYTVAANSISNHTEIEKAIAFNENTYKILYHYAEKFSYPNIENLEKQKANWIFNIALKYGDRQRAKQALQDAFKLGNKGVKQRIKYIICMNSISFNTFRKKTFPNNSR